MYLHCHTKDCNWSQDDFWTFKWKGFLNFWKWNDRPFGYNPLSVILEYFTCYYKPRFIKMDCEWAKDKGYKTNNIHSWRLLFRDVKRQIKSFKYQKWWTYNSWQKVKKTATCPKCKQRNFDID